MEVLINSQRDLIFKFNNKDLIAQNEGMMSGRIVKKRKMIYRELMDW